MPPLRSVVSFQGGNPFRAIEQFYAQSEQRPARYFCHHEEDFVLVTAQPGCDLSWLESLTDEQIRALDDIEKLSLLEQRRYRWECGCTEQRLLDALAPRMQENPADLFGGEETLRAECPRCGKRYLITRETLEAHVISGKKVSLR
jgi:molecular chaperone Hsp33